MPGLAETTSELLLSVSLAVYGPSDRMDKYSLPPFTNSADCDHLKQTLSSLAFCGSGTKCTSESLLVGDLHYYQNERYD